MTEDNKWDGFIEDVRQYVDSGRLDDEEIVYKREIGKNLAAARDALLAGNGSWLDLLKAAIRDNRNNLVYWRNGQKVIRWLDEFTDEASASLLAFWSAGEQGPGARIRSFASQFPEEVIKGPGVRLNVISVLLMGMDPDRYPPYREQLFSDAYKLTGYPSLPRRADEGTRYEHALNFLEFLVEKARSKGLERPSNPLEAQSVVWGIQADSQPDAADVDDAETGDEEVEVSMDSTEPAPNLQALAAELLFDVEELRNIEKLLDDKRQVIFQGPPGTGKTYAARKLARCLAGAEERVKLVQFHPSYAFEDFVQGFRPGLVDGHPGFELRNGPLLQAAKAARSDRNSNHFLVIDEINRGNLAKVFGELYFLLEYRDEEMDLQYSSESFALPKNLYIIGTMNTADRSIALVDLALRRRFHFVEFHPDRPPVQGLLRRWLEKHAPEMVWVADAVERANEKLDDRQASIGPSYFIKKDRLDDDKAGMIWEHNVLPYIEERLYGERDPRAEFDLDRLRRESATRQDEEEQQEGGVPDNDEA